MYLLDTNLYIKAFRDTPAAAALDTFYMQHMPQTYLSAVVAHELAVGAQDKKALSRLKQNVIAPFVARGRVVTPLYESWLLAGEVSGAILRDGTHHDRASRKGFFNDVLLAVSCRERGFILVTENDKDFAVIRQFLVFRYVPPWP